MQMKLALAFEKLVCHNCQKTEAYGLFVHRIYKNSPSYSFDEKIQMKETACVFVPYRSLKSLFCDEQK